VSDFEHALFVVAPLFGGFVVAWSCVILFLAHQLLTVIGYSLGMRATWR